MIDEYVIFTNTNPFDILSFDILGKQRNNWRLHWRLTVRMAAIVTLSLKRGQQEIVVRTI